MAVVTKGVEERERVIVRFAGDSGDGMQLAGGRFTDATAALGNDLATLPNFPAEIRAPAGTLAGVSSFQIHFAARDILTPGDTPNVLVAMNPAALKANIADLERGATIIANEDAFTKRNLQKAGYEENPLDDGSLEGFVVHRDPDEHALPARRWRAWRTSRPRDALRAKNLFALGLLSWLYDRPTAVTEAWIEQKFARNKPALEANLAAFRAGWAFGETTELIDVQIRVPAAHDIAARHLSHGQRDDRDRARPGRGERSQRAAAGLRLLPDHAGVGAPARARAPSRAPACARSRPRTRSPPRGWRSAPRSGARSASPRRAGPGMDLKAETIGLAVMLELPMLIIDVQRAGPSTGMPTKTEQSDLLMALYGRHGESPLPIVCATTPAQCFDAALEAVRIAVRYRTPVILLTDLFLANSSEPWRIPDVDALPAIDPHFATRQRRRAVRALRAQRRRRAAVGGAGHAGSAAPDRRDREVPAQRRDLLRVRTTTSAMTDQRRERIARIEVAPLVVDADPDAELLVLGWGSSYGTLRAAVRRLRDGRPADRARPVPQPQPAAGEHRRGARRASSACSSPR